MTGKQYGYHVATNVDEFSGIIETVTSSTCDDVRTEVYRQIMDTGEQQIRDALIKLGWTPPK